MATKKIFAELSDSDVVAIVKEWRELAGKFYTYSERFITPYYGIDSGTILNRNKEVYQKAMRLKSLGYANKRLELKRWRELFKEIAPCLRLLRSQACTNGQAIMDRATALYETAKPSTKTAHCKKALEFDITGPLDARTRASDLIVTITTNDGTVISNIRVTDL